MCRLRTNRIWGQAVLVKDPKRGDATLVFGVARARRDPQIRPVRGDGEGASCPSVSSNHLSLGPVS